MSLDPNLQDLIPEIGWDAYDQRAKSKGELTHAIELTMEVLDSLRRGVLSVSAVPPGAIRPGALGFSPMRELADSLQASIASLEASITLLERV